MHFSYVKSNILRKYYVTMFTPEHSLLRRSIPLLPPGQPSHQARLPTQPAPGPPDPAPPPTQPGGVRSSATAAAAGQALAGGEPDGLPI